MKFNRTFILLLALLSVLTSCGQKDAPTDLDAYQMDRSAEQILKQVKRDGFVVMEDGDVSVGQEIWRDFYDTARQGKSASVKLATYHTLENQNVSEEYYEEHKDEYPVIYLAELSYDGRSYTYRSRNGLDGQNGFVRTYPYLVRYEDIPKSETATYTVCERYVLVHDADVTYDRLQYGLYSSQMGDYIDHFDVYSDYQYKPEYQEREKSK
jgi:hypothetical protein